ncbi:MAG TPA: cobalamin biosynthesis protein [Streptosporangiaceae bacterium]|nr:cobalamin biosynthesis protein [Streptosporangiaceae bacterium]
MTGPRTAQPPLRDAGPASRPAWPLAAGLVAGVAADALAGDPRRGHPVSAFGFLASALEDRLYADSRPRGAGYAAACVLVAAAPAAVAGRLARRRPWLGFAAAAAATWAVTGARSLAGEAAGIGRALQDGDLAGARAALPRLCGRDPRELGEKEIARAVVESVAENSSDAIVAPLVWGAAAGTPGLTAYRAVNTLDAMVGHHTLRLERFGWAAARLDDVANWIPARLTALLTAACAPVVGGRPAVAWRAAVRYGSQHPSPNAGWCEAAFAGALGIRLGGTNSYAGRTEHRPELGDGRAPEPADIARAIRLCRAVTAAGTAVSAVLALAAGRGSSRKGAR